MMFDLGLLYSTMVMQWHALWCVWIIDCYCFALFLCEDELYVYEIPDLTIFESSISYSWFAFQSLWEDWGILNDLFLMISCCDMFDLTILESSISIILGYFLVFRWEPMDIVIYLCCFPVAHRELMWLLWLSLWCFPITCIGLRWFYYDSMICDFMSLG